MRNIDAVLIENGDYIILMSSKFNTDKRSLRGEVKRAIKRYYRNLDGEHPIELYDLTLSQIEPPLLEVVMKKCRGNQSEASKILGLNRGTLRKKLAKYGLL